jgi:hypothetical protein
MWSPDAVQIEFDDQTDDPVVTMRFTMLSGNMLVMANLSVEGRTLVLTGLHIQASQVNRIGPANLRRLAELVMERMDYDELRIEGASRTTGANPGHRPGILRFTRRLSSSPGG